MFYASTSKKDFNILNTIDRLIAIFNSDKFQFGQKIVDFSGLEVTAQNLVRRKKLLLDGELRFHHV